LCCSRRPFAGAWIETHLLILDRAAKEVALREAWRYFGYFALISNEKMDAVTALQLYRMKDVVGKAFG